jgi:tRNA pseudouridine38-40 synthase
LNRYFLHIAYNGAPFCGWQRQQNVLSVQQALEEALSALLRICSVSVVGCGRTDTGVNAGKYFAHFDIAESFLDGGTDAAGAGGEKFLYRLNAILPKEIVVYGIYKVSKDMHARFSAVSRTYKYYIHTNKNPFLNDFSHFIPFTPDIEAVNRACGWLTTQKDFTSFAKLHTDNKTNLCDLTRADITPADHGGAGFLEAFGNSYVFTFTANRFLRNMVRAMVGTLLEVGCGKISFEQLQDIAAAKDRSAAAASAPAKALFLVDVRYPQEFL